MTKDTRTDFTSAEYARYSRHIIIPEFGLEGQQALKNARVLIIGSGGLGSPSLLYLAAAGVGHIGIVDFDTVDDSNLQRQVLFTTADIGASKAVQAKKRLQELNPYITIQEHEVKLDSQNARELIRQYDVVADGTDNFPTRYLVNDACVLEGKVNVYASIFQFEGQVSVFNYLFPDGTRGPNYRDIFPEPPPPGLVPNCSEGGVLGVLPGIIGSMQALEVIKVITGVGDSLAGKLFLFDAASFNTRFLKIRKNEALEITALIDYHQFCGLDKPDTPVPEITVAELAQWRKNGVDYQLIDVREPYEFAIAEIGGELMPVGQISSFIPWISREKKVVIHCRSGVRSARAIRELQSIDTFDNLYNLKGGIIAWSQEIDPTVPQY